MFNGYRISVCFKTQCRACHLLPCVSCPMPPRPLPLIQLGFVVTYWLVVQAMPSPFQRLLSGGLRQDCSRSMALVVRRGEITWTARPGSGHCSRIWGGTEGFRKPGLLQGQTGVGKGPGPWLPTFTIPRCPRPAPSCPHWCPWG